MKNLLLILVFMIIGCKDKEPEKVISKATAEVVDPYFLADHDLNKNSEKLMLLSILKKIPKDTLRLILRDYLKKKLYAEYGDFTDNIDSISQKHNISKFKIASIIFSYRYEMLTKDEIEQSAIENSGMVYPEENGQSDE